MMAKTYKSKRWCCYLLIIIFISSLFLLFSLNLSTTVDRGSRKPISILHKARQFDSLVPPVARVARTKRKLRIICTIIKNEARFLKEWIDFHLLTGFDRIVIYDHQSSDNPAYILHQYTNNEIDYMPITWNHDVPEEQYMSKVQVDCYDSCFRKYWQKADVIGLFDVDEFVFPAPRSWNVSADPLGFAFQELRMLDGNGSQVLQLPCFRFGINHHIKTPEAVISSYTHRVPYNSEERSQVHDKMEGAREVCRHLGLKHCCQRNSFI
jgi:hypothetical protein